jgi:hypothetical protein
MNWASHLKDLSYDLDARYDLLVASYPIMGPDYALRNIDAGVLVDHIVENDIPEHHVYIVDHHTQKSVGLRLAKRQTP